MITIETMFHRSDGGCSYVLTVPCKIVEACPKDYDFFVTICALLEVRGLVPDPVWTSMHNINERVWRIWGNASQKG